MCFNWWNCICIRSAFKGQPHLELSTQTPLPKKDESVQLHGKPVSVVLFDFCLHTAIETVYGVHKSKELHICIIANFIAVQCARTDISA